MEDEGEYFKAVFPCSPLMWKTVRDGRQPWCGPFIIWIPTEDITLVSTSAWQNPPLIWKPKITSLYLAGYLYNSRKSKLTLAHLWKANHQCSIFWSQRATKLFILCILKGHWHANLHICKEKYIRVGNKVKASSLPLSSLPSSFPPSLTAKKNPKKQTIKKKSKKKRHFAIFPRK